MQIEKPGRYAVKLSNPRWEKIKEGFQFAVTCTVIGGGADDGKTLDYYQVANNTYISSGKNAGKRTADVCLEALVELGMSAANPMLIHELQDKTGSLVADDEEYQGKKRLKAKFLNPLHKAPAAADDVSAYFAAMGMSVVAPAAPVGKPAPAAAADDLNMGSAPATPAAAVPDDPFAGENF